MILQTNWNIFPNGSVTKAMIENFSSYPWMTLGVGVSSSNLLIREKAGADNNQIIKTTVDGNPVLELKLLANSSPCCYFGNRTDFWVTWGKPIPEIWAKYKVKWKAPYVPGLGGKVPIVLGTEQGPPAGGNPTDGTVFTTNMMWHEEGNAKDDSPEGSIQNNSLASDQFELKTFRYSAQALLPGQSAFGEKYFLKNLTTNQRLIFTDDTWYEFVVHYKVNTPGQLNGISQVWVNGVLCQDKHNYNWRGNTNTLFENLRIQHFPGGNTTQWEENVDRSIYLSDITVSEDSLLGGTPPITSMLSPTDIEVQCDNDGITSVNIDCVFPDPNINYEVIVERSTDGINFNEIANLPTLETEENRFPFPVAFTNNASFSVFSSNFHSVSLLFTYPIGAIYGAEVRYRKRSEDQWKYVNTKSPILHIGNLEENIEYIFQFSLLNFSSKEKSNWSEIMIQKTSLFKLLTTGSSESIAGIGYYFSNSGNNANSGLTSSLPKQTLSAAQTILNVTSSPVTILLERGSEWKESLIIPSNANGSKIIPYGTGVSPRIVGSENLSTLSWTSLGSNSYKIAKTIDYAGGLFKNNQLIYPVKSAQQTIDTGTAISIQDTSFLTSKNYTDAQVTMKTSKYTAETQTIESHVGSTIEWSEFSDPNTPSAGYKYYIYNHPEFFTNSNDQWYYKNNELFLNSSTGITSDYRLPQLDIGIFVQANNCIISDIDVHYFNDAIVLKGSSNKIEYCNLSYNYNSAIFTLGNPTSNSILSNKITNISGIGIYGFNGNNYVITNNLIQNIANLAWGRTTGKWEESNTSDPELEEEANNQFASGISFKASSGQSIQYNSLKEIGYNGIRIDGRMHNVSINSIENTLLQYADGGAIYSFEDTTAATTTDNNLIRYNNITNSFGNLDGTDDLLAKKLSYGVYLDERTKVTAVAQNTFSNCENGAIRSNYETQNNIFVNNLIKGSTVGIFFANQTNNLTRLHTVQDNIFVLETGDLAYEFNNLYDESLGEFKPSSYSFNIYVMIDSLTGDFAFKNDANTSDDTYNYSQWLTYSGETNSTQYLVTDQDYEKYLNYIDFDILNNNDYYYRLYAKDLSLTLTDSARSSIFLCEINNVVAPDPLLIPNNFALDCANVTPTSLTINWDYYGLTDPSIKVVVERSLNNVSFSNVGEVFISSGISFLDSNLTPNTLYYYRLYASNGTDVSEYTTTLNCTTDEFGVIPSGCIAEYSIDNGMTWVPQVDGLNTVITSLANFQANKLKIRLNCDGQTCVYEYDFVLFENPISFNDSVSTNMNTSVLIDVLDNDYSNCQSTIVIQNQPSNGVATIISDQIQYTPSTNFLGLDSFNYYIVDCINNNSNTVQVDITVNASAIPVSIMSSNTNNVDAIIVDSTLSENGSNVVTGGTSGYHKFKFELENTIATSFEITKQIGSTWTSGEISSLESIGIFNVTGVFNGVITFSKNPNQDPSLAEPIVVTHNYSLDNLVFSDPSTLTVCRFGIYAFETESQSTPLSDGNHPIWPVGGIEYTNSDFPEIYSSGRYRLNNVTGNYKVIEINLPCLPLETGLNDVLNTTTSLTSGLESYIENKTGTDIKFKTHSLFQDGVTNNASFFAEEVWRCDCDNQHETQLYLMIENIDNGSIFKLTGTNSEVIAR